MSIERAALQAGYPVGPLQISDELNMELMVKIRNATKAASSATAAPTRRTRPSRSSTG